MALKEEYGLSKKRLGKEKESEKGRGSVKFEAVTIQNRGARAVTSAWVCPEKKSKGGGV